MSATLRLNPDRSEFEVTLDGGEQFEDDCPDDGIAFVIGSDGTPYVVALDRNVVGIDPNQIYKLTPITTTVETDVEFGDEDEDDENDEDEDDVEEVPPVQ